jgi:ABC-type transport system involved in Fe-S cluster assembly fused permease/ATPase subunit
MEPLMAGRTTIIIAHRLSTVTSADRILVLDGGNLVETGKHSELIDLGGVYSMLWNEMSRKGDTAVL